MQARRAVPEGIRITKVGMFYVLFTLVVGLAATNTGNNALYLVLAVMLAALILSGLVSRHNLRGIDVRLESPDEIFAGRPFWLHFGLRNPSRFLPRWLLISWVGSYQGASLTPFLPRRGTSRGTIELELERRGRHRLPFLHLSSIFPLGLFRKGMRYRVELELLAYPRLLSVPAPMVPDGGKLGDQASRRPGWGHELLDLRRFRPGDDPRRVHWKQTARTGTLMYTERESEEGRRISVVCDNGVGKLEGEAEARFEYLVSEAATAACDYLARGFEVELVTRDSVVGFGSGPRQRRRILEELALLEPGPLAAGALVGRDPKAPQLRLAMARPGAA